jgi:pimeloyl-ACP methyl ester carboxylesterase
MKLALYRIACAALSGGFLAAGCMQDLSDQSQYSRTPILFVHGSGLSSASWTAMRQRLLEVGYPSEYLLAIDMLPADGDNKAAALNYIEPTVVTLLARAQRAARQHGARAPEKVDIVAHSMGAFSSRWYLAEIDARKTRLWIGLAGANSGSNALCGSGGSGNQQMCPAFATAGASETQNILNGTKEGPRDPSPFGIGDDAACYVRSLPETQRCLAYYTLRIEPDEWIDPAQSAKLDGAGGLELSISGSSAVETEPGNFLFTPQTIHDDLPKHAGAIEFVLHVVGAADSQMSRKCGTLSTGRTTSGLDLAVANDRSAE